MNNKLNQAERLHLARVKELPCSVCDASGPSEAHHIKQGNQYTCVALCESCHRGYNGLHGTKAFWRIRKLRLDAGSIALKRVTARRAAAFSPDGLARTEAHVGAQEDG